MFRPDPIHIAFDDRRLAANTGLLLPVALARHPEQGELIDRHVDLGRVAGHGIAGDKMLTLVISTCTASWDRQHPYGAAVSTCTRLHR